jgi:hypothetical protein
MWKGYLGQRTFGMHGKLVRFDVDLHFVNFTSDD